LDEAFYKNMFLVGAVWNVLGGGLIVTTTEWIFASAGLRPPEPPLYYHAWIALFVVFGIGYYMVSRDLYRNKNIVVLGIIGKLAFSAIFIYNMMRYPSQVPWCFLIPVIGDLVFVVLFGMFLGFARGVADRSPSSAQAQA
jgi:hypothetical protein